jgi:hypothetical protein
MRTGGNFSYKKFLIFAFAFVFGTKSVLLTETSYINFFAMRTVQLLLTLSFALIAATAFTQVKPVTEKEVFLYKFDKAPEAMRALIEKLCAANGKSAASATFGFTLEKTLNLDGSQKSLKVIIKPADFKGDFQYKGFNVGNFILPKSIAYKVLEGSNAVHDVQKSDLISGTYTEKFPLTEGAHKYKFSKVSFIFGENQIKDLENHFALIDAYAGQKNEIAKIEKEISETNFSDAGKMFENEQKLRTFESRLNKFVRFNQELNLADYDPEGFRPAYYAAVNRLEHAKETFESSAKDIHVIFYKRGLELMEEGKNNTAILYFSQAANRKPDYAPPHIQLARIAYANGDFDLVENELLQALKSVKLDEESRDYAVALFTDMFWYFLKSGDSHLNDLAFENAVEDYKKAENLLSLNVIQAESKEELTERLDKVRNDQFEYMLSEARFKVFQNYLDVALKELRATDEFAQKYAKSVKDPAQTKEVYQLLFEKAIEYAEQYNGGKNYVKAIAELKIADQVASYNENAQMTSRFRKALYEANLGLAAKMTESEKIGSAVEYLHAAEQAIAPEANAASLTSDLKKRKKSLLDKYFGQKIEAAKAGSEDEKRKIAKELIQLVIKYGYSPVAEHKDAYNTLVQDYGN